VTTFFGLPDLDFVIYNGRELVGMVTGLTDEMSNATEDVTVASNSVSLQKFVGIQDGSVQLSGFYDDDVYDALQSAPSGVLMYALEGNTRGKHCACCEIAKPLAPKRSMEARAFHKSDVNFAVMGSGGAAIEEALLVAALAARTTAGTTDATYVDLGATAANGVRLFGGVTALTLGGYTNAKLQLRHSADHVTFANVTDAVLTFTDEGALMAQVTSSVNRYLSIGWSYTGSGTGQSTTFAAAAVAI